MSSMTKVRTRHINLMEKTLQILVNMLDDVNQKKATTLRDLNDGADGWTTLDVVCHLRDFDEIFHNRARMMIEEDDPQLPAFDHEALVIENEYADQDLAEVVDELIASRKQFIRFYQGLSSEQWERAGTHPESGQFSLTDSVMQVGHHDVTHIEQIVRILEQK